MPETILIFHVRQARNKAKECAKAEALCLLGDLQVTALKGGPLADKGGVFWIQVPPSALEMVQGRLPRLGYTFAVDTMEFISGRCNAGRRASVEFLQWRGATYRLNRLYEEDAALLRERSPDKRLFALATESGETRLIRGYRGNGQALSRRALAVCDARLLVNLVHTVQDASFLDPFAGAGGIVLEALDSGYHVLSADIDPILRPGLERLGAAHYVTDANQLPIQTETIDAIATEPPFDTSANEAVFNSLEELYRVLKKGGNLAMLCSTQQAKGLKARAELVGLESWLTLPLNRKGIDNIVLAWRKL